MNFRNHVNNYVFFGCVRNKRLMRLPTILNNLMDLYLCHSEKFVRMIEKTKNNRFVLLLHDLYISLRYDGIDYTNLK